MELNISTHKNKTCSAQCRIVPHHAAGVCGRVWQHTMRTSGTMLRLFHSLSTCAGVMNVQPGLTKLCVELTVFSFFILKSVIIDLSVSRQSDRQRIPMYLGV